MICKDKDGSVHIHNGSQETKPVEKPVPYKELWKKYKLIIAGTCLLVLFVWVSIQPTSKPDLTDRWGNPTSAGFDKLARDSQQTRFTSGDMRRAMKEVYGR